MTIANTLLACFLIALLPHATAFAADRSHLSSDPRVQQARGLVQQGRFLEALAMLRSLEPDHPDQTDVRFLIGLAAMGAADEAETDNAKEALLDEAIAALRAMLIDRPGLVRVRLELARAFFLNGDDGLSQDHFLRVLASRPPPAIAVNVTRFLQTIRGRRRWQGYLGASLAPDTNVTGTSGAEFIVINGLPFRLSEPSQASSGVGIVAWGGGEYQDPLDDRWRWRTGLDFHHTEYERTRNDRFFLSAHTGPRLLYSTRTDVSLLGVRRRFWVGGDPFLDVFGGRLEAGHRLTRRLSLNGSVEYVRRDFPMSRSRDGTSRMLQLGTSYLVSPTIQVTLGGGYEAQDARVIRWENERRWFRTGLSVTLPYGFNVGGSVERHWTDFRGDWFPFTFGGESRSDLRQVYRVTLLNRALTFYGFSPQLVLTRETVDSNAQLYGYDRDRADVRLVRQF